MSSNIVNLNKARKAKQKLDAKKKADENALRYGRSKAERLIDAAQNKAAKRRLDQLKFDDE